MIYGKPPPGGTLPWAVSKGTPLLTIQEFCKTETSPAEMERCIIERSDVQQSPSSTGSTEFLTSSDTSTDVTFTDTHRSKGKTSADVGPMEALRCPVAKEFQQARVQHSVMASTGCTRDFCQAGRAVHTDEPRVGENRGIRSMEMEAEGFLQELYREGFFDSHEALINRLDSVLKEIRTGARDGIIREDKRFGTVGGSWQQTPAELKFGIRRAWRNARKCIMRSHSDELELCDLRHITSSSGMASELVRNMSKAFNGGNILPTVFVFPPRNIDSRGPMIWNHQFLEFAGYDMGDGSILGDPMSAELTKAIIELGWKPPGPKSRWDLLPLVVMAENDVPVMIELPPEMARLVEIRHPKYNAEFEKLDLKWVTFPALTRLGFDVGGVQYTAAPFSGWFMDAEIGVRDLADTFRYNALPNVAQALGLIDEKAEDSVDNLDDLPEYERLSILSRAQLELTHAVNWSYQQAKVSMSDTFTASIKWCRYDDEFKAKNGFRLPADPYWLAPPQGSIVPLWHRGGAPNYQPKPMICRHVQDPLKAWKREKPDAFVAAKSLGIVHTVQSKRPELLGRSSSSYCVSSTWEKCHTHKMIEASTTQLSSNWMLKTQDHSTDQQLSIVVYFCSAGAFAEKMAVKLHDRLKELTKSFPIISVCSKVGSLDQLQASTISPGSILLLVVSSTGQGELPNNGNRFINMCNERAGKYLTSPNTSFRYAVYGNGDSRYAATYNGAAILVEQKLRNIGGLAFAGGLYQGDTALQATTLQALNLWWGKLQPAIQDIATHSPKLRRANSIDHYVKGPTSGPAPDDDQAEAKLRLGLQSRRLLDYCEATVMNVSPAVREHYQGTYLVTLDMGSGSYEDMGCIQILPINAPSKVRRALRALGVSGSVKISLATSDTDEPDYSTFLSEYIDLELSFRHSEWLQHLSLAPATIIDEEKLRSLTSLDALEYLHTMGVQPAGQAFVKSICLALPLLQPRTYSLASSLSNFGPSTNSKPCQNSTTPSTRPTNRLDILVKPLANGRFSQAFLSTPYPCRLRYRLLPSSAASLLTMPSAAPLIIVATGAGFAPVRCLLQRRIAASRMPNSIDHAGERNISLFLGLKAADVQLVSDILNEAAAADVLGSMSIVSSNDGVEDGRKVRVYDRLLEEGTRERLKDMVVERKGWVFVCTNPEAARCTREAFEEVLAGEGGGISGIGERWVEEVF
ncbi:MAG: hypothetical protein Q9166_007614 [cf. Caloplaca sp. 2 TL-2023]